MSWNASILIILYCIKSRGNIFFLHKSGKILLITLTAITGESSGLYFGWYLLTVVSNRWWLDPVLPVIIVSRSGWLLTIRRLWSIMELSRSRRFAGWRLNTSFHRFFFNSDAAIWLVWLDWLRGTMEWNNVSSFWFGEWNVNRRHWKHWRSIDLTRSARTVYINLHYSTYQLR